MSGDEVLALIGSLATGLFGWSLWIGPLLFLNSTHRRRTVWLQGIAFPVLSLLALYCILSRWSAQDVRSDPLYMFFYMAMGFGWTGLLMRLFSYFGLSCREDLFERDNGAAGLAIGGVLVGCTVAFAGGNIGDGPGWWVVVFSSGLATGTLIFLWMAWNWITPVADAVTIDRDMASAWRVLGFFIGGGLITGRAAAGNWDSAGATVQDFVSRGYPVLLLWILVVAADRALRPSPSHPARAITPFGIVPAVLYILAGLETVRRIGWW